MASKSKPIAHSESKSPSKSPPTSPLHSQSPISKREFEKTTTTAEPQNISDKSTLEPPEVQYLIHKLQGFSISPKKSEVLLSPKLALPYIPFQPSFSIYFIHTAVKSLYISLKRAYE